MTSHFKICTNKCIRLFSKCVCIVNLKTVVCECYLVRDEVLAYRECHLDGVWLMGD